MALARPPLQPGLIDTSFDPTLFVKYDGNKLYASGIAGFIPQVFENYLNIGYLKPQKTIRY
jgi:hypothetical protein